MRSSILVAASLLGACTTAAPAPGLDIPVRGAGGGYVCRQQGFEAFVGQVATREAGVQLLRASGARTIRWVKPGMRITMDYREDRLTVRLASNNRIITAGCG